MIENSAAGLVMVPGDVTVTITGEEHHQEALARYDVPAGVSRHVAVHLAWCMIARGRHRGERGIEVRLDGQRVGELTFLMSRRYAPVLMHVESGGGATGCPATVQRGPNGLPQIVVRMPRRVPGGAVVPVGRPRSWVAPVAIGAASVFAFFLAIGVVGAAISSSDRPSPVAAAPTTTTTAKVVAPPTSTTTPATTTTTTTTTTTPPAVAQPKPQPQPQPKPQPQPAPAPPPQPKCDPNYSGCVPIASDVDCAGGSGDGPAYVAGPVRVVGSDIYRLDSDKDGVACE